VSSSRPTDPSPRPSPRRGEGEQFLLVVLIALVSTGCRKWPPDEAPDAGAPVTWTLELSPSLPTLRVIDGAPVSKTFTARFISSDGSPSRDVTAETTFTLGEPAFGTFSGATLTVTGARAGHTELRATTAEATATTGLVVRTTRTRTAPGTDSTVPALFANAADDPGAGPDLLYPEPDLLLPPGFGDFDVHWADDATNDLHEVVLSNTFSDVRLSVTGVNHATLAAADWAPLADAHEPLTLVVSGMTSRRPLNKGTSTSQRVSVTNEPARGALYLWANGLQRTDLHSAPTPFFPAGQDPASCIGCYALSRDGAKLAVSTNAGTGGIFNVADRTALVPLTTAMNWTFATFNDDGTKLVGVLNGVMTLFDASTGAALTTLTTSPSLVATHPAFSPDGTQLAYVETAPGQPDVSPLTGTLMVRAFDTATNTFGPARVLVASSAGAQNYQPSWSPDGVWLAFTRTGGAYANPTARTWVVKTDGSAPPIELTTANGAAASTNSIARWLPFAHTLGTTNTPVFFLTFGSTRPFGGREVNQVWLTPFFPERANRGVDPSGPASHVSFQDVLGNTHDAQWTTAFVGP
jgi:WD40-like Beta Propeller Repeat